MAPHGDLDIDVDRTLQPIGDIAQAVEAVGLVNLVKPLCQQLLNIIEIAGDGFDVRGWARITIRHMYDDELAGVTLCVPKTSSECDAVMESPKLAG